MFKKFYRHKDNLFIVLREVPEYKVNSKDGNPDLDLLKEWRDWVGANHVLRLPHSYLLCKTIEDLKFEEL